MYWINLILFFGYTSFWFHFIDTPLELFISNAIVSYRTLSSNDFAAALRFAFAGFLLNVFIKIRKSYKSLKNYGTPFGGGAFGATNKIVRKQKNPKTTQINPKTTDQQFYNEEDSEFEEDEQYTTLDTFTRSSRNQSDFETKSKRAGYPDLINKMLVLCVNEKDFIKGTCAGRIKSHYQKVFQTYKDKMEPRDRAIINSGLNYIYNFNRSNSIPKENAIWLISINDIPISHIVSYTSKNTLKEIAKDYGISCSNKKAEELIANIREAVEKN